MQLRAWCHSRWGISTSPPCVRASGRCLPSGNVPLGRPKLKGDVARTLCPRLANRNCTVWRIWSQGDIEYIDENDPNDFDNIVLDDDFYKEFGETKEEATKNLPWEPEEVDPEGEYLTLDKMAEMRDDIPDYIKEAIKDGKVFGPPVVLLAGFRIEEIGMVRAIVDAGGGEGVKVVPVFGDALQLTVEEAVELPEPIWEDPRPEHWVGGGWGSQRCIVFGGMKVQAQAVVVELLEESGLPPVCPMVATLETKQMKVGELLADAVRFQRFRKKPEKELWDIEGRTVTDLPDPAQYMDKKVAEQLEAVEKGMKSGKMEFEEGDDGLLHIKEKVPDSENPKTSRETYEEAIDKWGKGLSEEEIKDYLEQIESMKPPVEDAHEGEAGDNHQMGPGPVQGQQQEEGLSGDGTAAAVSLEEIEKAIWRTDFAEEEVEESGAGEDTEAHLELGSEDSDSDILDDDASLDSEIEYEKEDNAVEDGAPSSAGTEASLDESKGQDWGRLSVEDGGAEIPVRNVQTPADHVEDLFHIDNLVNTALGVDAAEEAKKFRAQKEKEKMTPEKFLDLPLGPQPPSNSEEESESSKVEVVEPNAVITDEDAKDTHGSSTVEQGDDDDNDGLGEGQEREQLYLKDMSELDALCDKHGEIDYSPEKFSYGAKPAGGSTDSETRTSVKEPIMASKDEDLHGAKDTVDKSTIGQADKVEEVPSTVQDNIDTASVPATEPTMSGENDAADQTEDTSGLVAKDLESILGNDGSLPETLRGAIAEAFDSGFDPEDLANMIRNYAKRGSPVASQAARKSPKSAHRSRGRRGSLRTTRKMGKSRYSYERPNGIPSVRNESLPDVVSPIDYSNDPELRDTVETMVRNGDVKFPPPPKATDEIDQGTGLDMSTLYENEDAAKVDDSGDDANGGIDFGSEGFEQGQTSRTLTMAEMKTLADKWGVKVEDLVQDMESRGFEIPK